MGLPTTPAACTWDVQGVQQAPTTSAWTHVWDESYRNQIIPVLGTVAKGRLYQGGQGLLELDVKTGKELLNVSWTKERPVYLESAPLLYQSKLYGILAEQKETEMAGVDRLMRRFPLPWSFLLLCFPFFIRPTDSTSFNWKRWTENRQMTIRQCMQGSHTVPRSAGICLGSTVWSGGFNLWSSRNGSATRPLLMSLRADRSLRILRELTRGGAGGGIM
jgi:hypothetical protein